MKILTVHAAARSRLLVLISTAALVVALTPTLAFAGSNVRLMIDPGHGGKDPGAIGNSVAEKDMNLQISLKLVKAAQRQGWHVGLTRSRDRFIPLTSRSAFSNKWEATAFVSIHSNSVGPSGRGNMTIHRGGRSGILSQSIMNRMQRLTPYSDIGSRQDVRGLAVLRTAHAPSVIVEVLSVSSTPEAATLRDPLMQSRYAEAIVMGVADYHGVTYIAPKQHKAAPKPTLAPEPKPAPAAKATLESAPGSAPGSAPRSALESALNSEPKATQPDVKPAPELKMQTESVLPDAGKDKSTQETALMAATNDAPVVETRTMTDGAKSHTRTGGADSSAADQDMDPITTWLDGLIERLVGTDR